MEDSFEQIALLMNNAFLLANAPAFPSVSFTLTGLINATEVAATEVLDHAEQLA